jgi:hypothetical protein
MRINNNLLLWSSVLIRPEIVSTLSRPPCAAGGTWVNSIEGPELAFCDWQVCESAECFAKTPACREINNIAAVISPPFCYEF